MIFIFIAGSKRLIAVLPCEWLSCLLQAFSSRSLQWFQMHTCRPGWPLWAHWRSQGSRDRTKSCSTRLLAEKAAGPRSRGFRPWSTGQGRWNTGGISSVWWIHEHFHQASRCTLLQWVGASFGCALRVGTVWPHACRCKSRSYQSSW